MTDFSKSGVTSFESVWSVAICIISCGRLSELLNIICSGLNLAPVTIFLLRFWLMRVANSSCVRSDFIALKILQISLDIPIRFSAMPLENELPTAVNSTAIPSSFNLSIRGKIPASLSNFKFDAMKVPARVRIALYKLLSDLSFRAVAKTNKESESTAMKR